MITKRAFRYELYPNDRQRTLLFKCAGVARFAYNWGLAERIRLYHEKEVNGKGLGEDDGALHGVAGTMAYIVGSQGNIYVTGGWVKVLPNCKIIACKAAPH